MTRVQLIERIAFNISNWLCEDEYILIDGRMIIEDF